jgi:hypothetical protein
MALPDAISASLVNPHNVHGEYSATKASKKHDAKMI